VSKNPERAIAFISLGQLRYLSAIQYMDAVIGNSSSGIVEVPAFKKPTINIGDRQKGRIMGASIINCEPNKPDIIDAIKKAISEDFKKGLNDVENPYGEGGASLKIKEILKNVSLENILKKQFYDIQF
jgi:GDP/UDP-N,N'-diacetylbacillosamine 2-epimerase (hydrolysing)